MKCLILCVLACTLLGCQKATPVAERFTQDPSSQHDQDFIGLTHPEAQELANLRHLEHRVSSIDGEDLVLTADYVPGRLSFVLKGGVVTQLKRE